MENVEVKSTDIARFKRGWKKRFQVVKYTDELSKDESVLFKNDPEFLGLIVRAKDAEQAVYDYMDEVVKINRMKLADIEKGKARCSVEDGMALRAENQVKEDVRE